ncbi:MAG: hypothetical protein G01um101444_438, partial [Parcubacteria group bacterium Gr01-1014_44]
MENFPPNPEQNLPEMSVMSESQMPSHTPAGTKRKLIIGLLIAVAIIVGGYFVLAKYQSWWPFASREQGQFCTIEAKLCPDGSYVG